MPEVIGKRREPDEQGRLPPFASGDYGRDGTGRWWIRPPGAHLGTLEDHEIVVHEDGTITATPSIEGEGFHGYLQRGVWKW